MDKIQHVFVEVKGGLKIHVAEIGTGDQFLRRNGLAFLLQTFSQFLRWFLFLSGSNVVVFLHGFPEIWYSWRHQMIAVANAGFRAIAIDYRGYGLSDPPPEPSEATYSDLITDLLEILDHLDIPKVLTLHSNLLEC